MNDEKLLELAAKAAGIKLIQMPPGVYRNATGAKPENNAFGLPTWNPLTDDGDAFRLAAKLKLQVAFGTFKDDECVGYQFGKPSIIETGENLEAAAREVIVRTAAEIGKEMK
jgi:hypothetical protein